MSTVSILPTTPAFIAGQKDQLIAGRDSVQKGVTGQSRGSVSDTQKGEIAGSQTELPTVPRPSEPR